MSVVNSYFLAVSEISVMSVTAEQMCLFAFLLMPLLLCCNDR